MKIFDCFMFYDENMLLDVRLNILDKYVDYFIIVESKQYHNGKDRTLQFRLENFKKYKDKIIYIVQEGVPKGILELSDDDGHGETSAKLITNAHLRENYQRNQIMRGLTKATDDDFILISDVDEIPNLDIVNIKNVKLDSKN